MLHLGNKFVPPYPDPIYLFHFVALALQRMIVQRDERIHNA
jgi:hypothetical protein